ncbi:hypothetical protein BDQ12DRAFT_416417 [Crucibulum laeve]|uniref:MIT domain-containing protein n=1 Tax=Crucibulum laeve TaxID=68775 RepID=A0A5C3M8F2_9AGAR|nr:hypothetical protein BDQ12DRAFT_416417 [Crucibulum laeve]
MKFEYDSKPIPHNGWAVSHDGPPPPASFSTSSPQTTFPSASSSILSQRRRSSAAHVRPAGPPPNLPIPSLPGSAPTASALQSQSPIFDPSNEFPVTSSYLNGTGTRSSSFTRNAPSSSLTAIATFSQSRQASASSSSHLLTSQSSAEDLSDPPPQSFLRPTVSRPSERHRDDRLLLSPPEGRSEHRPSSRRALTRALELAREAVQLDSTNDNPQAAVNAYAQSVALLSQVMERVRRGEESTESRSGRRRRSVAAQEEEVRRLQNIHDTYADRMNILSIIYSIPAVPYPTSSVYSLMASTDSTTSNSPTNSASPSSDTSPQIPVQPYAFNYQPDGFQLNPEDNTEDEGDYNDSAVIGSAITLDESLLLGATISGLPSTSSQHPYATPYDTTTLPQPVTVTPPRSSLRRSRLSSHLPPPPPPPINSLPPAPVAIESMPEVSRLEPQSRHRGASIGHKRTGSGLAALEEERQTDHFEEYNIATDGRNLGSEAPRTSKRESHPLPPLPSPSTAANSPSETPRTTIAESRPPPSPRSLDGDPSRPRRASQLTTRTELVKQPHMINATTSQGTIHQRRAKTSAPPSSRSSSPTGSTASASSTYHPPPTAAPGVGPYPPNNIIGRSRSSSQPGRRPSLIGGRISPDQRPPLPGSSNSNGMGMRKSSFPSRPNPQPNPLSLITDSLSPSLIVPGLPSPSTFSTNLPTTPTSPLPPTPPTDPLLKPYHMMNLLRNTMTSSTGGYVTRRLHVPCEVWSQGGAKLSNVVEKVRVVDILCSALEDLQSSSADYFGAGNVSSGMALGIGSIGRKEADGWLSKLEEFSNICDGVMANFGKKLGVGEGFVVKKTTWGDKLTRRFDKLTNGKNLDSPAAYVQGLKKLFLHVQLLDEHTKAVLSQPIAPAYSAFPMDIRTSAEQKLKRSSQFFASVVLTFVIQDLSQLLDKYAKKCEKWLAE